MSKDAVGRAIKRGAGGGPGEDYEEIRYEGYGPGVASGDQRVTKVRPGRRKGEYFTDATVVVA